MAVSFRLWRAALALVFVSSAVSAQVAPAAANLPFATVGGRELQLDLYLPAGGSAPYPVVVWLHDGGWLSGNRVLPPFVPQLLDRSIAIASIDYRLTTQAGQYGSEPVTFPAQIHDVKAAIRFLRAHAGDYGLDPRRIGVWGSSSGGHLAALAGASGDVAALEGEVGGNLVVSSRVQAVVDYYGPTDLLLLNPDTTTPPGSIVDHDPPGAPGSLLLGFSANGQGLGVLRANAANPNPPYPNYLALARAASPLTHADADDPPFYIVHGTADPQVAVRQSERLRDALAAAGAEVEFVPVAGGGHGGFPSAVHAQASDFLVRRLTAPTVPIGDPAGITGAWFDPAAAGQGVEFMRLQGDVLLVVFYGHRDDGSNLYLIGTRQGALRYGEEMQVALTATRNGRYNGFDPATVTHPEWGNVRVRFTACDRATATLEGQDGSKALQLQPLVRAEGAGCD